LSAIAGVVHFIWLVKADERRPIVYAAVLAALLLFRAGAWFLKRSRTRSAVPVMPAAFSQQTANSPDNHA
jgi:sulfoxide reductase heme-binding subunit YedZ